MADQRSYFVPFDLDTGGGTEFVVGMSPRGEATGGSAPIFSAPLALVDNTVNPTTGGVQTFGMVFDGATWDRMLGDATDGLLVNLGTNNDVTVVSGSIDVQGPTASDAPLTADPVTIGGRASTATPTAVSLDGDVVNAWLDLRGAQKMVVVDDAGDSAMDGANNSLNVSIVSGASGVSHIDDAAFTEAVDDGVPAFGLFHDVTPPLVTEGRAGIVRISANRNAYETIRDAAGNERGANVTASNELNVIASAQPGVDIGDVDVLSVIPGAGATNLGKAEDGLHTTGDVGVMALAVRDDTPVGLAPDGDYHALTVSALGGLWIQEASALDVSAATVTVDSELPAAAALTDANANPTTPMVGSSLLGWDRVNSDWTRIAGIVDGEVIGALNAGFLQMGSDGTNYQAITTDAAGHLQVDVLTGGGSDTPTNPVTESFTSAAVAVATPTDVDTSEAANKKLAQIDIYCTTAWKGEVFTVDNAVESSRLGVCGGAPHTPCIYKPVHRDYVQLGATAGLDAFRLKVTNLDDNLASDFHVVFHYED